jgi:uncharacterized membrane protein
MVMTRQEDFHAGEPRSGFHITVRTGVSAEGRIEGRTIEVLLDSGTESFQEVVLVEYPVEDSYCVAFVTAETPPNICEATANVGPGMTTVYLPMAPNPVMGGFVVHISNEKVYEVDMTVEEGVQSVVTSGIAVGETDDVEEVATVSGNANLTGERHDSP